MIQLESIEGYKDFNPFPAAVEFLRVQCMPETNISVFYINVVASQ